MGALLVIVAFLLPLLPYLPKPPRVTDRLQHWLIDSFGESGAAVAYLVAWSAALIAVLWAARFTDLGLAVVMAFVLSSIGVGLFRWMNGESVDFD